MCCPSLPVLFTCPKIFEEKQRQKSHCIFLYYFLNSSHLCRLNHVHSHFTAMQLLGFPPVLTQRRFPS